MPPINIITVTLCYGPLILAAAAIGLPVLLAILQLANKAEQDRRAEEWHKQRIASSKALQNTRDLTREFAIAKIANEAEKRDLEIEALKLKIMQLERDLGVNSPGFKPDDYES
jgi:hypothetical protein